MKKIIIASLAGLALVSSVAMAQTVNVNGSVSGSLGTAGGNTGVKVTALLGLKGIKDLNPTNTSCLVTAVTTRDNALSAAFVAMGNTIGKAYTDRGVALSAALQMTDGTARATAVLNAKIAFGAAVKTARNDWKAARAKAWAQFSADRKACGVSLSGSQSTGRTSEDLDQD